MESSPIAPTTGIQQSPYEFLESLSLWVHPETRLLICFDDNCKHAISPNGSHPTNHLRDKHKISLSRRKGLSKVLAIQNLKNPDQAAPLADGLPETNGSGPTMDFPVCMYYSDLKKNFLAQGETGSSGSALITKIDGYGEEWELVKEIKAQFC